MSSLMFEFLEINENIPKKLKIPLTKNLVAWFCNKKNQKRVFLV